MADALSSLSPSLSDPIVQLALAAALGLFLGLEREWSHKAAGIRTFALVSVLGALLTVYDGYRCGGTGTAPDAGCLPVLTAVGGLFVTALAATLMLSGLHDDDEGLNLTTAVSLVVAYGVGLLVAVEAALAATVVAVGSSVLLVFKRELHDFAWGLSREEMRSVAEFAILAFVIFPLLPSGSVTAGADAYAVTVEPRVVWSMVVFVAALGIVNYAVVSAYGSRGVAVTGFFGGLASSTAVVGAMREHASRGATAVSHATAGVLLADAAMALRNLLVVVVFTAGAAPLLLAVPPLAVVLVASLALAALVADWGETTPVELESPFSMRNALAFGALFLLVVVAGSVARSTLGVLGFYAAMATAGLVSSAGATTTAVVLYRTGSLSTTEAAVAVVIATGASVAVKAGLAAAGSEPAFARSVAIRSAILLAVTAVAGAGVLLV